MNRQSKETDQSPPYRRLSVRTNFSWVFAGDLAFAASGWFLLVMLVKMGGSELVGLYALGVAISMPVNVLTNLGLTGGLITDTSKHCAYGHYLSLRLVTSILSIVIVASVALFLDYSSEERLIIVLVSVSTAIAGTRELLLAVMKRNECMNLVGISQVTAAITVLVMFTLTFWLTQSLAWSVLAICLARASVALIYDLPHIRKMTTALDSGTLQLGGSARGLILLGMTSAPLALAMTLGSLAQNIPRYFLEGLFGAAALGTFATMAAVVTASNRLMNALGTAVLPRLARSYVQDRRAFVRLTLQLFGIGLTFGSIAIVMAHWIGEPILTLLFTAEVAQYQPEFVLLMINLTIMFLVSFTNQALVATRAFLSVSLVNACVCVSSLVFSWWWIRSDGVRGACWALIATSICWFAILLTFYMIRVRKTLKPSPSAMVDECSGP